MTLRSYQAITDRLESIKLRGSATDYLVRWVGMSDQLKPYVTIWNDVGPCPQLRAELTELLAGFVSADAIEVVSN